MPIDWKEFVAREKGWDPKCLTFEGIELSETNPGVVVIKCTYRPALKAAKLRYNYIVDKEYYKKISGKS